MSELERHPEDSSLFWDEAEAEAAADEELDLGLVVVRLGAARFAIDVANVVEVVTLRDITELFRTPAHIRGITNLRGRVLPVADLGLLLHVSSTLSAKGLLVHSGASEAIFTVDEVFTVRWIDSRTLAEVPATIPEAMRGFFAGVTATSPPATLLVTDRLFADAHWLLRPEETA